MQNIRLFAKRIMLLIIVSTLALLAIIARLAYLQISQFQELFYLGECNFLRTQKICSPRGTILDHKGRPLATNVPITTLYWRGTQKKEFDDSQIKLLDILYQLVDTHTNNEEQKNDFVTRLLQAERQGKKIIIVEDIPFDTIWNIIESYANHPNISFTTSFKRNYPYKTMASHIIGYLGCLTSDFTGQMGLEKIYESELKGIPGAIRQTVNSRGTHLAEEEIYKAKRGADLYTTIDLDLQLIAEDIFPPETAGVFLVMNARNGALRAILSRPAFDPNIFIDSVDQSAWKKMQSDKKPFLNRPFSALYPPASLFKLVTVTAALEHHIINLDSTWYCSGYTTFAGRRYHCSQHLGHGPVNTMQAVAQSCNIPFFDIAKHIKIDTLADYAHRFGLGCKTSDVFPEKDGLIPTSEWKRLTKGEQWWPGETLSAAIGQSYLLVTPIQMARMVAGICEGYLVRPCILEEQAQIQEREERQKIDIQENTREFLKLSMKKTVERGTGRRLSFFGENFEIYAKTGTAQTIGLEKVTDSEKHKDHAWLTVYFKYKTCQPLLILIILENAGLSTAATAVAKKFLSKFRKLVKEKPDEYL